MSKDKILIVDDEANVLSSCERLLRKEGFEIETTTSPEEALRKVGETRYAVILSDQRMPEMEGSRLLEQVRSLSPDTIRVILTGYADIQAAIEAINRGAVFRFLTKPWNDEELRSVIHQAVAQYRLVLENRELQALTQAQNAELKELNQNLENKVIERTQKIATLNEELQKSFLETVQALSGLAEMHSSLIGNHSKRVAHLSRKIGEQLGIDAKGLFELEVAAALHDIGKVGIAPEILSKPEMHLSAIEQETLKRHPTQGETVLRMVQHLNTVPRLVRHHHERFEGNGFPDGLKGHDIPLGSRVIAVANAFDKALNSRTAYQNATPEKACQAVRQRCPVEFDPDIVAALIQCIEPQIAEDLENAEIEVRLKDLRIGMVLSRDLETVHKVLLLPKETTIQEKHLSRIQNFQETDPIIDSIFVYRKK